MVRYFALAIAVLALCGCTATHNLYLQSRTTGTKGVATVKSRGAGGGDISIDLGGKVYSGRWVYAAMGGSVSFGTATAYSGLQSAGINGMASSLPTSGNGSVMASAADGSALNCRFDYSEATDTGLGACQDSRGEVYDLQIN